MRYRPNRYTHNMYRLLYRRVDLQLTSHFNFISLRFIQNNVVHLKWGDSKIYSTTLFSYVECVMFVGCILNVCVCFVMGGNSGMSGKMAEKEIANETVHIRRVIKMVIFLALFLVSNVKRLQLK